MQLCDKESEKLSDGNSVYLLTVIFYDYLVEQEHRPHHLDILQGYNVTYVSAKEALITKTSTLNK
jgi:hypothetical protein